MSRIRQNVLSLAAARVVPDAAPTQPIRRPLGAILEEMRAIDPGDLAKALALRAREDTELGRIMLTHGMVSKADLYQALALQHGTRQADLLGEPPDARLIDAFGIDRAISLGVLPWKRAGQATVIATARPEHFERVRAELPPGFGPVLMAVAPEDDIHAALMRARAQVLVARAETRVDTSESCRDWDGDRAARVVMAVLIGLLAITLASPVTGFLILCAWAVLTLVVNTGLKLAAAIAQYRAGTEKLNRFQSTRNAPTIARLPTVSILVPLFHERAIAEHLIRRLRRIDYPKELLDICLVVEADDHLTRGALSQATLPNWVRSIVVPRGALHTKPRALNFALDFCRGSIIGIYDAEDAPEAGQIHRVVRRFHERGAEVACLQGVLDFYNARSNWLSRCFTIEYATWFRLILPGLARMGFAIPLGGTTVFFRRDALEELGGWDAHNVTEDADLGLRLARHGYRTELIQTVTEEEANCRTWPWVKQRSRWLKGYAVTWAVHMRSPRLLLRQLGLKKFLGVQMLFLGSLSSFLLAPVIWSFWAIPLGLWHPFDAVAPRWMLVGLGLIFFAAEIINLGIGILAVSGRKHRFLIPWVPTLHGYFPLGALASYKAIYELLTRPFYWDKTSHGHFARTEELCDDQDSGPVVSGLAASSASRVSNAREM